MVSRGRNKLQDFLEPEGGKAAIRRCLKCRLLFKSWGAANRLCSKCGDRNQRNAKYNEAYMAGRLAKSREILP